LINPNGVLFTTTEQVNVGSIVASTVINHTGITEGQTLTTGGKGEIYLMGGRHQPAHALRRRLGPALPARGLEHGRCSGLARPGRQTNIGHLGDRSAGLAELEL
jgi:hypothetical protein